MFWLCQMYILWLHLYTGTDFKSYCKEKVELFIAQACHGTDWLHTGNSHPSYRTPRGIYSHQHPSLSPPEPSLLKSSAVPARESHMTTSLRPLTSRERWGVNTLAVIPAVIMSENHSEVLGGPSVAKMTGPRGQWMCHCNCIDQHLLIQRGLPSVLSIVDFSSSLKEIMSES